MEVLRPDLLFLCHRIPYPPDKGDKIRSYRWFSALVENFRVHLGAFIDDPADWAHVGDLQERCASTLLLPLPPTWATVRSLTGLLRGTALTFPYYRDERMRRWVEERLTCQESGYVLVFSSAMGQYVEGTRWSRTRRVIDFVDVDSDKWRQYAKTRPWPASWVYQREAERLAEAEARLAGIFDASVFVSDSEADLFRGRVGRLAPRVVAIPNGVDSAYFASTPGRASPFPSGTEPVVFTGAMDYWANADAVLWFVREVWPRIRACRPQAILAIVGARPSPEVQALGCADVQVTGWVPDVRPYLQHALAVVAPMRIARGIQNKVLEGMAMGRPVVVTPKALEGLEAVPGRDLLLADGPLAFAEAVLAVLNGDRKAVGVSGRRLVERHYHWAKAAQMLLELVSGSGPVVPNEPEQTAAIRDDSLACVVRGGI